MILFLFQFYFTFSCCLFVAQINKTIDNKGLSESKTSYNFQKHLIPSIHYREDHLPF